MKYYVADAFADNTFEGNPAGVCVLDEWLPHDKMQKIAMENNLSETGFVVKKSDNPNYDIVARAFWPKIGINEDPVCGSMHSTLMPFWGERLGKDTIASRNLSKRSGTVYCEQKGDAVKISGRCALYLIGEILTDED
ncbi:MAG: PhzF family phenazine biosynthesis protein [Firmicutes bacterium]|nr:PhzF family phenazine biosynthesis protein [Bacillota bacterium]